ncbi:MAG TPA: helix-turn-helix transcriptional regulator [Nevskiaceae bacterium]|nr:helix-turn-helix transcriptional regulator [Nevskiaceae bacterium]
MKMNNKEPARRSSRRFLAHNLMIARTIHGWSQEQLGLQSGLKRTYIGAIERCEINPGVDNLDKLAKAIGVASHVLILEPEQAHALLYRSRNGN